ncbi:hypothetical protein PVAP13_9KG179213 [Panicum virgatum]|uniref:Uncharacterized protein n=1 Tax=Panicum virgatum TaxID=38727 RepID=A0A8T0NL07_PANVG|nr:hypothetical protein PVAP13_9KG179213 [Panicum virgatum]
MVPASPSCRRRQQMRPLLVFPPPTRFVRRLKVWRRRPWPPIQIGNESCDGVWWHGALMTFFFFHGPDDYTAGVVTMVMLLH